jgi:DNA-binding XRE family transcriptional regulator
MSKHGGWDATGFGGKLKQVREQAGLSQQELAERTGCNKFTVAKLEQGKQEPAWPLVLAFCRALGVNCLAFVPALGESPTQGEMGQAPFTSSAKRGRPKKPADAGQAAGQPKKRTGRKAT